MLKYECEFDGWVCDPSIIEAIQRLESRGVVSNISKHIWVNCPDSDMYIYGYTGPDGFGISTMDISEVFPL
jgi:hypothetical protein